MNATQFPVLVLRDPLLDAIRSDAPVVIEAPTGSGKSTALPLVLLQELPTATLVVEPRRIACRALAERVASLDGSPLGERVGYAVRFEERRGPATRLLFATPGVALRLLADPEATPFPLVFLDEFHERSWQLDLLACALRMRSGQRLILASATLDAAPLTHSLQATHLRAEGRLHPVALAYAEDVGEPSPRDLGARAARAVHEALGETEEGDILVFLPGKGEIAATRASLQIPSPRVAVHEVHGGVALTTLSRALAPPSGRERRVYLATNLAETSLTLPGVRHVIDSGLERRVIHRGGRNVLALQPISRASMDQRAGRAGRVAPGHALRLFSRRFRPSVDTTPEVGRVALDDFVLAAANLGIDQQSFEAAPWITTPPHFAVASARERLVRAGLLDTSGHLTSRGAAAERLPVDAAEGALLQALPLALRGHAVDLIVALRWREPPLQPLDRVSPHRREDVGDARKLLFAGVEHAPGLALRVLRGGHPERHGLHAAPLQEARREAQQLRLCLGLSPGVAPDASASGLTPDDPPWSELAAAIAQVWPWTVFVRRARAGRRHSSDDRPAPWTNGDVEVMVAPFSPPTDTGPRRDPICGLLLNLHWVGDGGTGFVGHGTMLLPMAPRGLVALGLGTAHLREVAAPRKPGGPWVGRSEVRIAEIVLDEEEVTLRGEALVAAVSDHVIAGRWLPEVAPTLRDRLHLWRLTRAMPSSLRPPYLAGEAEGAAPPDSAGTYLRQRLTLLGVTEAADLALLDREDYLPDLEALTGWPPDELVKLGEDFPRQWALHGAVYDLAVDAARQRVVLTPANPPARKAGPPPAALVPRCRGLAVYWEQGGAKERLR